MPAPFPRSPSARLFTALLAPLLMLLSAGQAQADKPQWQPVSEMLLVSFSESDPMVMSEVMSRCTALNMILSGLSADDESNDVSDLYRAEAEKLIQHAVLIDADLETTLTGESADMDQISEDTIVKVRDMVTDYNLWLDDNLSQNDSLFSDEFDLEVDSCQLAARFARHMHQDQIQ